MSTILVVDDMAVFREPIAAALRVQGFETLTACDGKEALSVLADRSVDLMLLDVAMPGMDGLALLRVLRKNPQHKQIPIILLTAVAERDYVKEAGQLGVQDYLLKSHFSLEDMMSRIQRRLGGNGASSAGASGADPASGVRASRPPSLSPGEPGAHTPGGRDARPPVTALHNAAPLPAHPSGGRDVHPPEGQPAGLGGHRSTAELLSELKPIITRDELLRLVSEGLALRPLAPVVQNVMATTSSPRCSADDVAKAVSQDQALCIRILKLANGSVYSRGMPVDSLRMAVGRVGSREVRNLVMTLGVLQQYEGRISEYVDARLFWEHSAACGLIASAVARCCSYKNVDDFFLWGLLHDVGRLILIEHLPEKYAQVWETARDLGLPLERVEARLLTLDHCSTLEKALEHWRFPREFIVPVVNHHQSAHGLERLGSEYARGAAIVAFADRLSKALLLGSSGNDVLSPFDDLVDLLGLRPEVIAEMAATIPYETDSVKMGLLLRTNESLWPGVMEGLRNRLKDLLRPLYAGPRASAVELFFSRVTGTSPSDDPNVGVVYVPDTRQQHALLERLEAGEHERGGAPLPLLLVVDKGQVDAGDPALTRRRHCVVKLPARPEAILENAAALVTTT